MKMTWSLKVPSPTAADKAIGGTLSPRQWNEKCNLKVAVEPSLDNRKTNQFRVALTRIEINLKDYFLPV